MKQELTRREFNRKIAAGALTALSALQLTPSARAAGQEKPSRKPNIIYIMADDLGYGDLGCYGQKRIKTPNIDRMAQEGLRFTDCYAGSTVCAPSRCSLMTGYHMGHARVRGNKLHPLLPEDVTVAEILKNAGYYTGLIGKWGLGQPDTTGVPNRQGFDFFYGYLNQVRAHNYYPDYLWRNEEREYFNGWKYSHDVFMDESLKFIREHREDPFFLYLALTIPHAFNEGREQGMQVPTDKPYSDPDWPQQEKNRAAMITRMDTGIGQLLDLLKELDLDKDTIIFFTSDNGPHSEGGSKAGFFDSNGPLRGIKRDLYDGGIRVPMIVRWTGKIAPGSESDFVWAFWDFLPTAAEIAGAECPEGIDGFSVLPALLGNMEEQKKHDYLYWEFYERGYSQAVRKDQWKAVKTGKDQPVELFNIKEDISESNNIADQHPDIVKEMENIMREAHEDHPEYPVP
ncbi:MAG: arylsulfatase [bacterium]|jgi:arylsulfatase A-like enzyme